MQELETGGGGSSAAERTEPSDGEGDGEEGEEEMEGEEGGGRQLDFLFETEQGAVRRAGWLSFKALITVSKDRKLELTYGKTLGAERELSPRYALLADDSIVQSVPEHPKKEHVFCLSNSHGDVYLFQIQQWEQNLEKLNLDLFRLRCYQSSLQGGELPNPKSLLAVASRPSKSILGRLGVCSRDEGTLRRRCRSLSGGSSRRRGLPSSLRALDASKRRSRDARHSTTQVNPPSEDHIAPPPPLLSTGPSPPFLLSSAPLSTPFLSPSLLYLSTGRLLFFLLLCLKLKAVNNPECVSYSRDGMVRPLRGRRRPLQDVLMLCRAGDEVLAVNGAVLSGLDLDLMQSVFSHRKLQLLLRRDGAPGPPADHCQPPDPHSWTNTGSPDGALLPVCDSVSSYTSRRPLTPTPLLSLSMGALCWVLPPEEDEERLEEAEEAGEMFPGVGLVERLLEEAARCLSCRWPSDSLVLLVNHVIQRRAADADVLRNPYSQEAGPQPAGPASPAHLSVCQRLRRVIEELVDTEKSYVNALFGSLPEMLDFQRVFLQTLEERIASCPNFSHLETPAQFKELLFSLGGSFLYYADHFKHYSGFCANHIKVQKVLERVFKRAVILVYRENIKLKKRMTGSRSADLDPFRFRWLIPVSAVQVRPANITGSENQCVWELVHSRSEVEGRPETVFQLCSSGLDTKASVLRALRVLLRERAPAGSLRRMRLSTAERRRPQRCRSDTQGTTPRHHQRAEESCSPDGHSLLGETCSEPLLPSRAAAAANTAGKRTRLCSLTGELEAQLQRLNFTEEDTERGAAARASQSGRQRRSSSLQRSPGGDGLDFSCPLERDFSVQSMTSMINEDCFYDS
ncbi:hypothetical protein FQN60_015513, partial [Etheostoma spectabile]